MLSKAFIANFASGASYAYRSLHPLQISIMKKLLFLILSILASTAGNMSASAPAKLSAKENEAARETFAIAASELQRHFGSGKVTLALAPENPTEPEGFIVRRTGDKWLLSASDPKGALYGAFYMIRNSADGLPDYYHSSPAVPLRILNHWDNLDGTIERGYAGRSIWKWDTPLTDKDKDLYRRYGLINATTGINGTVLNNVNASPLMLSRRKLERVAEIADILRPYGMRVYLSVNFATPMALDSLPSADPLRDDVKQWWIDKAREIYELIPDFGGFLVKANSEGQPGPMDFGRTHADGANMLADALAPYGGIVMWRAFVYSPSDADRAKQAYLEFNPLDGQFRDNVIIQIKNGPIDFQPREPHSPLFGAMPATKQMAELQVTQEYLGHSNHLVFLAPMWSEFFGSLSATELKGVAGVANVGDSPNLTAHPMAMANWYAFGRMAWDPDLTPQEIAREWLRSELLLPDAPDSVVENLTELMTESHEAAVDYMMPLGLHHIFAFGHHYGPEPWCDVPGAREDWLPRYYHRADKEGVGFDRTTSGSDAVSQYAEPFRTTYNDLESCPDELLLWFHHVPWDHKLKNGNTVWEELCARYQRGVEKVDRFRRQWDESRPYMDSAIHSDVAARLLTQKRDAEWWRDACLQYFGQFSGMPLPEGYPAPKHSLDHYTRVALPISNYECPTPELLDSVR